MMVTRDLTAPPLLPCAGPPRLPDWERVAEADPEGRFFAGPEFSDAYGREFGSRAEAFPLGLAGVDGVLRAVMPAMTCRVWRRPGLSARFEYLPGDAACLSTPSRGFVPVRQIAPQIGLEAATLRTHLVAEPGWHDAAWAALPAALAARAGWDMAVLPVVQDRIPALSAGAVAQGLLPLLRSIGREVQAMETLPPPDRVIARGSQKFAQNIRRAERFAAEAGAVFETLEGPAVANAMPDFAALAARSWKEADHPSRRAREAVVVPFQGAQRRFCESLVAVRGGLLPLLVQVRCGGVLQAACLGFVGAGSLTTYAIFQTPETGRESYGRLVLQRMFEAGRMRGARRVDLNATGQWTRVYADRIQRVDNLLLFRPGPYGRALHALARAVGERHVS